MTAPEFDPQPDELSLALVEGARRRISSQVRRTPTVSAPSLAALLGRPVTAKLELLQHSGSFKVRGAFNRMLQLSAAERARGVVAVSGGNHGIGVAAAAGALHVRATVVMPATTPATSLATARGHGAEVILCDTIGEAFRRADELAATGLTVIHPFDDPDVIAGQGTLGLELIEDAPEITDVIASIGGGGMISGVITAVRALRPDIRIWGVETEGAAAMTRARAAGHPVELDAITSIAKTLGAPSVSARTLEIVSGAVEDVIVVPDSEAVAAIETLADALNVITEPAAACTWAAAQRIRNRLPADAHVGLVLCGGNVSLEDIIGWRTRFAGDPAAG